MRKLNINNLIWIDLEMTGLDTVNDHIIEIATVVTDNDLNILAKGPDLAIFQSELIINSMNSWNTDSHEQSGLTEKVRNSKISEKEAEQETLEFLKKYLNKNTSPMCGNSVHQDRMFLKKHMPKLEAFFHYRNLDVSSFKIASALWNSDFEEPFIKEDLHTAMADTLESIAEMKHYQEHLLRLG